MQIPWQKTPTKQTKKQPKTNNKPTQEKKKRKQNKKLQIKTK